jgi:signal transduction histidine kinase/HAMP domain-containing protein
MRERRLQTYLLLVLLVAATVPSIIVGAFQLRGVHQTYRQALDQQHARAASLSREVGEYVAVHARAVRTLARQLETVNNPTTLDMQRILDTMRAEYPGIVGTFLGDTEGNSLVFSPQADLTGKPLAGRQGKAAYFEPLMRTKQMVYSDVIPGIVINNGPLVTMVAPLLDERGEVRYFISGGLDLSKLSERLKARQSHPDEEILLVDNRNTLIAHTGPGSYEPFANLGEQIHIQQLRSGLPWWESDSHLGGYATTGALNWGVAIITPRAAFYANVIGALRTAALTITLALALGMALAWLFARTMNQPIIALLHAAQAVRNGDMTARAASPRYRIPREMADLHEGFNEMVGALQQHQTALMQLNTTLEDRVAERTQQVTRRSEELAVLNATATSLTGVLDLGARIDEIARGIVRLVSADVGLVVLRGPDGLFVPQAAYVPAISWRVPSPEEMNRSRATQMIAEGEPVLVADVSAQRFLFGSWADDYPHASVCGVPVRADGTVVGALVAISVHTGYFDDHSADLLATLAGQVGPAVSSAWLFEELQDQWSTLRSITTSMHEGLLLVDPDHRVQFANPAAAALLGLSSLPPAGALLRTLFSRGEPIFTATVDQPGGGEAISLVDLELPGPPARTVAANVFPVIAEGAGHPGYGILLRDVTQERQLERFKDELLANVSHELRTPLTTILGNADTLRNLWEQLEPSERDEFLEGITDESRRLKELIERVLDMSRISSGALQLNRTADAWAPLIRRALKRARGRWPHHQFNAELPADLPLVDVDFRRIDQVLDNLLNNAAQYSPVGSTITVTAAVRGGAVQTEVCDMGVGIQPDQLNRIFDRFYRGSGPTTRHVRGTGLGLAICRGIVEAHGGKIWADSQPGQGARIMFTVPVVNPAGSEGGNPQ